MNWIKSQLVKLLVRHAANAAGAWFVSKGFLTNDDTDKLYGAVAVLLAIGHSLFDKRALIVAEVKHLADSGKLPLLLALMLPALAMAGCKSYQVVNATSGTGLNVDASVPIPMAGGQTLIGLKMIAGIWKNGTIVQPTGTNTMSAPSVAIAMTEGAGSNVSGSAGTNSSAGIGAQDAQKFAVLTGASSLTTSNVNVTTQR